MSSPAVVLVYHPDEAEDYARLIRIPAGHEVTLRVCATEAASASVIGEAEVAYAWNFPATLYAKAPRLRWLQAMGAGVDWALVRELPAR